MKTNKMIVQQQELHGWTHNVIIMERCKDDLEREFYIRMTRKFGWTKNVLSLLGCCKNMDFTIKLFAKVVFFNRQVIMGLQINPKLWGNTKIFS